MGFLVKRHNVIERLNRRQQVQKFVKIKGGKKRNKSCVFVEKEPILMFYAYLMNMHLFLTHIYLLSLGLIA